METRVRICLPFDGSSRLLETFSWWNGESMGLTWIAIAASLLMGSGALLIFIWAVNSQQFHSFEEVKYQVFWSDLDPQDLSTAHETRVEERQDGSSTKDK